MWPNIVVKSSQEKTTDIYFSYDMNVLRNFQCSQMKSLDKLVSANISFCLGTNNDMRLVSTHVVYFDQKWEHFPAFFVLECSSKNDFFACKKKMKLFLPHLPASESII
jgi:hypothetical protein